MKTVIRNSYTPKTGDYCETIVVDKETNDAYIFDCDGIFTPMPQPVDVEDILRRAAEYTDETVAPIEEKLDTIEEGAQVNVIETITQNGQPLTITDKTVNVTVPTKTSDLENDGSDGTDTYVESSTLDDYYTKSETDTQIGYETDAREIADAGLQEQIDAIVASSDVVDIVGTYAALRAYDASKLHDNDIIKVLTDETRDDATTYYRWDSDTSTWGYIGAEGPFYTKAESDALFTPMTRTINNKALSSDITLTAADVHALPDSTVIPTVNDATLTIQKNGTDVATFTANSASNQTANITVPTDTSDLTNDGDGQSPFATEDYVDLNGGKIDKIEVNGVEQQIVNKTVDITVPTKTSNLVNDGSDGSSTYVEADDLATVAISGDYDDLTNKPTIPTVNDATLTIQKNGTNVATFTANSSTNQTANITVPTDTSDLTNGAGFITSSALSNYYTKSETYSQGEVNNLINSLSIPTKTSDLTNDSGFISEDDLYSEVCGSGTTITFQDAPDNAPLSDFKLKGETSQNGTPTPDAPVAVQTVTGENVVKICGKNLLYLSGLNATDNGVANTLNNDGSITCSGTVGSGWNGWTIMPYAPNSIQAGTYTLSIDHAINVGMNITFRDSSNTNIVAGNISAGSTSATITLPRTAAKYSLWVNGTTGTAISFTIKAQLELGSTATAYEPYQEQSYEVNLGKNLAKMANGAYSYSAAGQTFTLLDGSITTTRTERSYQGGAINISTGALSRWSKNCASDSHLTGSGGTYTLTFSRTGDVVSSSSPRACIYGFIYDNDGNNTSGNGQLLVDLSSQTSGTYTLNLAADRHLGALVFYSQYISYSDVEFKVQFEKGSQATSYAAYFEPIELCKLSDVDYTAQDYIYKNAGNWYIHKAVTKVVLNGSENWNIAKSGTSHFWYGKTMVAPGSYGNPDNARWLKSNYGVGAQVTSSNEAQGVFILSDGSIRVRYGTEMSLASWTAKLAASNMELYYALATPTDTEITNEALIAQLEAILSQGSTYAGTNNITTVFSAGNAQGELEICYTKTLLPIATETNLGLVQIGSGLSITPNGVLSATGGGGGSVDWDDVTNRPTDVSYWTNDAGYITSAAIPTNVSSFTNDAGYITSAAIPTNVSAFTNDAGYLTSSALSNYYTKSETYNQSQVNALINSISIPTKTSDLTNDGADGTSTYVESDDLATVATSGSYNDLSNKPTIPTIVDMTGATASTAGAHGYVPAPAAGDQNKFLQGDGTWATPADEIYTAGNGINIDANNEISVDTSVVATQTDLAGKQDTLTAGSNMTISSNVISAKVDSALSASSTNPVQNSVVKAALDGKANASDLPTKTSDLTNDGSDGTSTYVEADELATVATSGSYNDLTNKPTIPTVNNATLTIQRNGTNVQTFTANSSSNKTANIQVPNLQTSSTDPGEGSALAADTFLGIYDIAPEDVDGARLVDGSVTAAKIDWSSIPAGRIASFSISTGGSTKTVTIPTQANTNYKVFVEHEDGGAYWNNVSWRISARTTTSFTISFYNTGAGASPNNTFSWIVLPSA